jgi:hypothetical protein
MPLATLPYHAKVTGTTQLTSGDLNLTITVYDGNLNVLQVANIVFPVGSVSNGDFSTLTDAMYEIVAGQMISDAGSFAAAVLGVSVEVGE